MKTILCFLPAIAASRFADTAIEVRAEMPVQQTEGSYKLKAWTMLHVEFP